PDTKIWDLSNGKPVSWKPPAEEAFAYFTLDGRWLVTHPPGNALHFWQVDSWQPGPSLPKDSAKGATLLPSPDGTLLARGEGENVQVQLLAAGTGMTLATLEPANDANSVTGWAFSPDGTRLACGTENHTIHVWDLRAIRRGLAEIGLDWHLPAYPPAEANP